MGYVTQEVDCSAKVLLRGQEPSDLGLSLPHPRVQLREDPALVRSQSEPFRLRQNDVRLRWALNIAQ